MNRLLSLIVLVVALLLGRASQPALGQDKEPMLPIAKGKPVAELNQADFEKLWKELQMPDQPWNRIYWHSSLTEARQKAQEEKKPLLIRCSWGTMHGVC